LSSYISDVTLRRIFFSINTIAIHPGEKMLLYYLFPVSWINSGGVFTLLDLFGSKVFFNWKGWVWAIDDT
jgi:hypothetical protein